MPILPENRDRYPADWPAISARIRERDGNRCKRCQVKNHALGGRLSSGVFCEAMPLGEKGLGLEWPEPKSTAWCVTPDGDRAHLYIVRIVLTVAHLNHTPEDCRDENLEALCQRCHNLLDQAHRRATAFARRRAGAVVADLFGAS